MKKQYIAPALQETKANLLTNILDISDQLEGTVYKDGTEIAEIGSGYGEDGEEAGAKSRGWEIFGEE